MTDVTPELTAQDETDLQALLDNPAPSKRTLLEIWSHLLDNLEPERLLPITPDFAARVVQSWPQMKIQDVKDYRDSYHSFMEQMRSVVRTVIAAADPEALEATGIDEDSDAVVNRAHYIEILLEWQLLIGRWERDWDSEAVDAHITLAAIADASVFFLGQTGLVAHLSEIGLVFQDEDREEMTKRLVEAREADND